jgi:hypothetical protein
MAVYRARSCPNCRFYIGYSIANPFDGAPEAPVESFCLNCNYHLPVRAVIGGVQNNLRPLEHPSTLRADTAAGQSRGTTARRPNYPRDLRAIGQELERRGFKTFNLKCSADGYFVWSTETLQSGDHTDGDGSPNGQDIVRDTATKMLLDRIVGFQFTTVQIERLEQRGLGNRRRAMGLTERGRLSQLLRTVGEQVYTKGQRLLAIAWRERQISVVTQNAAGRCTMDVLRSDNLYDLWVRMYLKRSQ